MVARFAIPELITAEAVATSAVLLPRRAGDPHSDGVHECGGAGYLAEREAATVAPAAISRYCVDGD